MLTNFTELTAWQRAHSFTLCLYKRTELFPKSEMFGLTIQMRRAAISIVSNIAEGFARYSDKENFHFNSIALGSLSELQCQLLLAKDLKYLSADDYEALATLSNEVKRLIIGLNKKLT